MIKTSIITTGIICILACNNVQNSSAHTDPVKEKSIITSATKHFAGAISNGMKGDSIRFSLSEDGTRIENLKFYGWWRCNGKLERQFGIGPDGSFDVINGMADGHISEPPNGGSTAWRFDFKVSIAGDKATGTFRMNINNLGCDTYVLKFDASAQ